MDFMTNTLKLVMVLLLLVGCQEQSKEVLVQDGMEMVTQGNPLGAIVLFSSALDKDANYITARHQLGLAYHKSGKLEKAEREFQKVRLQSPDNGVVLLDIASLYLDMRKIDDAEVEIRQFLKKHSKNTRSQEYLGRILNVRGDLNGAELLFDEAIELDEKNIDARLALAQFHMKQGRSSDARVLLIKAAEDFPKIKDSYYMLAALEMHAGHNLEALRAYRQVVIIDASDVGALYMASILALNIGNSVDAQQGVDDMSKRFPGHPLTSRLMGMVAYTDGDFENATVKLRLSLREIPDLISYYFLGLAEYKLGHFELALNQFRNALDIHSGHHQSRLMIGLTFLRQKRLDDCIRQITQVLEQNDKIAMAHNVVGSAYLAKGEFDKAMSHIDRAIELDPGLADAHMKKGLFNLSNGNNADAEIELEMAVEAAPDSLNNRLLLASLNLRQQNYRNAIEILQQGLDGSEQDALLYNYMAAAYLAQKQVNEGIDALNKAKQIKPNYLTPYFNLVNYYLSNQQRDKAIEEYRNVLKISPENVKALISLAVLQEIDGDTPAAKAGYEAARNTTAPEGFLALAAYLSRCNQPDEAARVVKAAYQAHPKHPAILETHGKFLFKGHDYAHAVKIFKALDSARPGSGASLLAETWLASGDRDNAVAVSQKLIDERPEAIDGYMLKAAIYQRLGEVESAEAALKQGISSVKDAPILSLELGRLYTRSQNTSQALETFSALRNDYPEFVPGIFALGAYYDHQGDKRKAVDLYRESLAKAENYTAALNNLAYLYADNYGSPEEGLLLAIKAFRNEPGNPGILDTLGLALLKNQRYEEAVNVLNKAVVMLPKVAMIHLHHGQALLGAGQTDEACDALQQAADLGFGPEVDQAQQLLKDIQR
ncbi:MAG: hypothetical protein BA874_08805 [Desulfuromonadales bacterium C00003068]|nr:MAG: hypothetical protein BA874_08805 [Desulfuromonadales bacterium C00003068]